jgi:hypothetical protein
MEARSTSKFCHTAKLGCMSGSEGRNAGGKIEKFFLVGLLFLEEGRRIKFKIFFEYGFEKYLPQILFCDKN